MSTNFHMNNIQHMMVKSRSLHVLNLGICCKLVNIHSMMARSGAEPTDTPKYISVPELLSIRLDVKRSLTDAYHSKFELFSADQTTNKLLNQRHG